MESRVELFALIRRECESRKTNIWHFVFIPFS